MTSQKQYDELMNDHDLIEAIERNELEDHTYATSLDHTYATSLDQIHTTPLGQISTSSSGQTYPASPDQTQAVPSYPGLRDTPKSRFHLSP